MGLYNDDDEEDADLKESRKREGKQAAFAVPLVHQVKHDSSITMLSVAMAKAYWYDGILMSMTTAMFDSDVYYQTGAEH